MAYKPVDRSLPPEYLKEQHTAIVWLSKQGMTDDDIRIMRWGALDQPKRQLTITRRLGPIKWHQQLNVKGTEAEHFFMKSKIYAAWMFVKERPRGWSREKAYASLYTPDEISTITSIKPLTIEPIYDTIRLAETLDVKIQNLSELERATAT